MDGTTEPLIAVIGHPIAGNPNQLALERALVAMKLEWRVMSFDVDPQDVATAIAGFAVTGIVGVMVDPTVMLAAAQSMRPKPMHPKQDLETSDEPTTDEESDKQPALPSEAIELPSEAFDCLSRDAQKQFQQSYEHRDWVDELIDAHINGATTSPEADDDRSDEVLWIGSADPFLPITASKFPAPLDTFPPHPDQIAAAKVIILVSTTDDGEKSYELDVEDWPSNDGSTLVIDLSDEHPDQSAIRQLGYRVIGWRERRIGTLERCLARWTRNQPPADVIQEAVEEYLGV